jgi:diguanylate cyclase (GGDEF)-like protein/putative nucleotidyltransferase with HDIG domain
VRRLINRLIKLLAQLCPVSVPRKTSLISLQGLLPLMAVMPVAIYAYATMVVVTAKSESHYRELAKQSLQTLAYRLKKAQETQAAICRDYAYWDDIYEQVVLQDKRWIKEYLDSGIVASFGFDFAIFQNASGEVIWQSSMDARMLNDLRKYALLNKCLKRVSPTGFLRLGDSIYICSAAPIRLTGGRGTPRGMLLVGTLVDSESLIDLVPGVGHSVALCRTDGLVEAVSGGLSSSHRHWSLDELSKHAVSTVDSTVKISKDLLTSYGILPIYDMAGNRIGSLVDISSCASLISGLNAFRRTSIFLILLCFFVGIAGMSYLKNRALALRANRDELTGLYNHGYLQERLRDLVNLATRYDRPLSVLMVDIDHFKFINDSHGHTTGDKVLKALATTMVEVFRATDVIARYGGEEFVVILPETRIDEALVVAERLRQTVQGLAVKTQETNKASRVAICITLTVSVGVAGLPEDADNATELLMTADAALAEAKRTRNCVFAYRQILRNQKTESKRLVMIDSFFRDSSIAAIRPLVKAIDMRKPGSAHHSEKTAEYAVAIGRELGLSTSELALLCKAALLHDIGEIVISDQLLNKTGRLSKKEFEIVKQHCEVGAQILSQSPNLAAAAEIVLYHHERYDGHGYPDGLIGEQIPMLSRIISVADSLDAMTSPRPYQETRTIEQAMAELKVNSGTQFDPRVVEVAEKAIVYLLDRPEEGKAAA